MRREKAIYHTLNKFSMDAGHKVRGQARVHQRALIQARGCARVPSAGVHRLDALSVCVKVGGLESLGGETCRHLDKCSALPRRPLPGHWSTCVCAHVCVQGVRVCMCARVYACVCVRVCVCELPHTYRPSAIRPMYHFTRYQVGGCRRSFGEGASPLPCRSMIVGSGASAHLAAVKAALR